MANAYSTAINYGSPIPVGNTIKYLGAIQQGMQQKFDINLAKIDELISKVATVPLARDKDKKYLGDKLQGLLSVIDANTKVDLTDNVVARQISAYVTTAIDDNVKEQLANSQKISSYQQSAAQRKKDKPELYSDANYAYGLDKSGYESYMKGDTDSLGSMEYVDYYDIDKNFTKKLEDFAKERGFERVLSDTQEGYVYRTVKGKQLTEDEVSDFFNNQLTTDPKLKQQFIINSHYNNRGNSDAEIIKSYTENSAPILKQFDTKMTEIDEKIKNVSTDDKATSDLLYRQKAEMQKQKDDFNSQLDTKNFNRDSFLYEQYVRGIKKSYVDTYAYTSITDITRDDFLLDVNKEKKDGTGTGATLDENGLSTGTRFKIEEDPNLKVKEAPNYTKEFTNSRNESWNGLQAVIKARLAEEGKPQTPENITAYYTALKTAVTKNGINLNATKGYDTQVLDAFTKVVDANKTSFQLTKVAKATYGKATETILTGLFGAEKKGLNRENLAITAPYTSNLLKKYKSIDQLPKNEKAIALYELATNLREEVISDESEKNNINFYINDLKKQNNISDKELEKYKPKESGRLFGGLGETFQGIGQLAWNAVPAKLVSTIAGLFDSSGETMQKGYEEDNQAIGRAMNKLERGSGNVSRGLSRAFSSDTDLSEIESGDINLANYKDPDALMKDIAATSTSKFDEILSKGAKKELGTYAIVLNPAIKRDEATVNAVNSAIVNAITMDEKGFTNVGLPVKDTAIKISGIKDGVAQVTYTQEIDVPNASGEGTKKGTSQVTVAIPLENLPKELTENLENQVGSFVYSGKNKNAMTQTITYSPPKDLDSKYDFTKNYIKNYGSTLSQTDISGLQTSGMADVRTKEDYEKVVERALPPEYAKEFTEKHLNSGYKVEWERPEGAGAGFLGYLIKDGKRIQTVQSPSFDYDQNTYSIYTMKLVNNHLDSVISDYRLKALKLRN